MEIKEKPTCPHCGARLLMWMPPAESSWGENPQYACFNDECSYFVRGWEHMLKNYNVKASYRYRFDPATGQSGPLAVWSPKAVRDRIIKAPEEEA